MLMFNCSISTTTALSSSSSSSAMTSSQTVSTHQQQQQHSVDIESVSNSEEWLLKSLPNSSVSISSQWQHNSMNGSQPASQHRHNSPSHSPRRLNRPDPGPYHVRTMDRSPLRRETGRTSSPLGRCTGSWRPGHGSIGSSTYMYCQVDQRNGLVSSLDHEQMDTSDKPLNLSTRVPNYLPPTNIDSRRRILTSGE